MGQFTRRSCVNSNKNDTPRLTPTGVSSISSHGRRGKDKWQLHLPDWRSAWVPGWCPRLSLTIRSRCNDGGFFHIHGERVRNHHVWCWLMLIDVDWCWLLIGADWGWLMLIDSQLRFASMRTFENCDFPNGRESVSCKCFYFLGSLQQIQTDLTSIYRHQCNSAIMSQI